jgi:hypothetical protein
MEITKNKINRLGYGFSIDFKSIRYGMDSYIYIRPQF